MCRHGAVPEGGTHHAGERSFTPVLEWTTETWNMAATDRITIDPSVMQGKPVIRGTRITVDLLLRKLSEGATEAALLDAYPHLSVEDIRASLAYAAAAVSHEEIVLTAPSDTARS